jgi:hypothetical protein
MSTQDTSALVNRQPLFLVSTKSLVGAVLLGLAFVLVQQIAHRIDALINPACVIIGGVTWATFTGLVVLLYRQPAGLITAEVAAFTALATGLSVLAPFFILANGAGSLIYSLVSWKCSMRTWGHHFMAQLATNLVGNLFVAIGLSVLLHLPHKVILIAAGITTTAGVIGGTILTKKIYENITRAGLIK